MFAIIVWLATSSWDTSLRTESRTHATGERSSHADDGDSAETASMKARCRRRRDRHLSIRTDDCNHSALIAILRAQKNLLSLRRQPKTAAQVEATCRARRGIVLAGMTSSLLREKLVVETFGSIAGSPVVYP